MKKYKTPPRQRSLKKHTAPLAAAAMCLVLSGCSVFDSSIEGLLSPPKLTETQREIYDALLLGLGGEAELIYPRSGNYRSAIILKNLDEEETEEAIVFYRERSSSDRPNANQAESGIRAGFLDRRDNGSKWVTVMDCPIEGADIESLDFYSFDGKVTIGISCSVLSQTEKSLRLMQYGDDSVKSVFSGNYSFMETTDLDEDGKEELFYVNYDSLVGYYSAKIWGSISDSEEGDYLGEISSAPLNMDITSVQKITVQPWGTNQKFLYLDYFKGDSTYDTQVLYIYKNLLSTPNLDFELKQDENFSRRNNQLTPMLNSSDIDGDGYVEIPRTVPIMGYETAESAEQLYFTRWYAIDSDYQYDRTAEMVVPMSRKYLTYTDISGEYLFYIPVRWQGLITAEKENNIVSFYKYDMSEKLLSVCVSKEGAPEGEKWRRYGEIGSGIYVSRLGDNGGSISENSMALTEDELNSCLQLTNGSQISIANRNFNTNSRLK